MSIDFNIDEYVNSKIESLEKFREYKKRPIVGQEEMELWQWEKSYSGWLEWSLNNAKKLWFKNLGGKK